MIPEQTSPLPATWNDLPDPRPERAAAGPPCAVRLTARALRHIVEHHWGDGKEPWDDWLPVEVVQSLSRNGLKGASAEDLRAVVDRFGQALRHTFGRSLLLCYRARRTHEAGRLHLEVWQAVLPCGAVLIVHPRPNPPEQVRTCYFRKRVCPLPPAERWYRLADALLLEHGCLSDDGGSLLPPGPGHAVRVRGTAEERTQIRFVSLAGWGFAESLRGNPFRGLAPWAAEAAPSPGRRRLRPRRRRPHDAEDADD
jgi:hypothetical protein